MPNATPSPPTARVLAVLDLLVASPEREFRLAEIVVALGINKATCHAIVTTMVDRGYLVRSAGSKAYSLGAAVIVAGHSAEQANPAVHLARTVVPMLARELDAECVASVVELDVITVVEWAPRPGTRGGGWSHIGQRVPLIPPFGAVHMAWAPADRVEEWLRRSSGRTGPVDARTLLDAIRERGFDIQAENARLDGFRTTLSSLDLDRLSDSSRAALGQLMSELGQVEFPPVHLEPARTYEINALAAPVFDAAGKPVLTLSTHPSGPLRGEQITLAGRRLRSAADEMTAAIGGALGGPAPTSASGDDRVTGGSAAAGRGAPRRRRGSTGP